MASFIGRVLKRAGEFLDPAPPPEAPDPCKAFRDDVMGKTIGGLVVSMLNLGEELGLFEQLLAQAT